MAKFHIKANIEFEFEYIQVRRVIDKFEVFEEFYEPGDWQEEAFCDIKQGRMCFWISWDVNKRIINMELHFNSIIKRELGINKISIQGSEFRDVRQSFWTAYKQFFKNEMLKHGWNGSDDDLWGKYVI